MERFARFWISVISQDQRVNSQREFFPSLEFPGRRCLRAVVTQRSFHKALGDFLMMRDKTEFNVNPLLTGVPAS